jgi:hypothetical protein
MNRENDDDRRVDDALDSLWYGLSAPSEVELQRIADAAKVEPRSLPAQRVERGGPRLAWAIAIAGIALLVGSGLGFGLGSSVTPSGTAAGTGVGLGFLPAPGWDVLQTGAEATQERPVIAIAANGAFAPEDTARGIRNSSGLPYSTLMALPQKGIVIVARFTISGQELAASQLYPTRSLPLRLRDASPYTAFPVQVRPERPLGQYLLRATANGQNVELQIYFGTSRPSPALIESAQRQIDRLVISSRKPSATVNSRALPLQPASVRATPPSRVLDRTLVCATALFAGARDIEAKGHRGTGRSGGTWLRPALASVTSGPSANGGPQNPTILDNSLVWMTAGRPSAASTLVEEGLLSDLYRTHIWGTLAVNAQRCRLTKARVTLSPRGLQGGALGPFEDSFSCATSRRVVVRVRAVVASAAVLRSFRAFARTTVPIQEGELVVQTEAGKRLVYAEVLDSGRARLFTAGSCFPS